MRYFTHRNKAGKDLVIAEPMAEMLTTISAKRCWLNNGQVSVDVGTSPIFLKIEPRYAGGNHFEIGSGTPGRWWQEITEERAKELLGGGAR